MWKEDDPEESDENETRSRKAETRKPEPGETQGRRGEDVMATTWTDEQLQVIETRHKNLLVSAAAGSGKTAVLVERIIRMITDPDQAGGH